MTSEAPAPRGLSSTFVLALGTFAVGTDAFVVAAFLPAMAADLSVSATAAGQSVTVFAIAYALLAPVLATLAARVPRRTLLVLALVGLAVANAASAASPNLAVLLVTRVLAAGAAACYTPNAGAVSAALVRPELRGRALAVVIGGLTVATAVGVPLGGLASAVMGWRGSLLSVAALCLVVALAVLAITPYLPGGAGVPLSARIRTLRRPAVLTVLPVTVVGMGACYTVYAYSGDVLRAVGVPAGGIVVMLFLYGVGAVAGSIFSGYATDRWGSVTVLVTAYTGMFLALALLAVVAALHGAATVAVGVLVFVWGATSWSQTPAQQHRLIGAVPQEAPLVISLNSSSIYIGIGLGTGLGGLALISGVPVAYGLGAVLALVAMGVLVLGARSGARAAADA